MPGLLELLPFPRTLQRLGVALLATCVVACGGGDDDAPGAALPVLAPSPAAQQLAEQGVRAGLPGIVVGEVAGGRLSYGIAGVRRVGSTQPLAVGDLLAIGSNGKAMTAVIAARLVERGVLRWDSKAVDVVPGAKARARAAYARITLADLLDHRGGIWAFQNEEDLNDFQASLREPLPPTLKEQRQLFARQVLSLAPRAGVVPGVTFVYSNGGYTLAGAMMEAATGKSYEALYDEYIAKPYGLPGGIGMPSELGAKQPVGHVGTPGQLTVFEGYEGLQRTLITVTAPSGNASTTPQGYAAWLQQHLDAFAGRPHHLPAQYVQRLRAAKGEDYVLGWQRAPLAGRTVYVHTGSEFAFETLALFEADGSRAAFAMANATTLDEGRWVTRALQEAALPLLLAP